MAADAGLTSSSWARGPYHQWGPMAGQKDGHSGDPRRMQFRSEFEWIAPSGVGLLTHYMPAHYAAGWWMDSSTSLAEAEDATYKLFSELKSVALTRNVLLPVGTDYTPPNAWVTDITTTGTPATPGRDSSALCLASSSPPCAPSFPNAVPPLHRRPAI